MPVVYPDEVGSFLRATVDPGSVAVAIRVAEGWLQGATRIVVWPPDPVPPNIWSWAVELAALAYDNPRTMTRRTVGAITAEWNYRQNRRLEILTEARRYYAGEGQSLGDFPFAWPWPEPADWYAIPTTFLSQVE